MLSKKILTMQDLSCVGQCSLTVALPVLSAYGVETCVLPTAILSNHTAFKKWSCLDLTSEMNYIMAAWRENGFKFDAFLLGYLGSAAIMNIAKVCFKDFAADGAKIIIDPAFGDNGKLYPAFDKEYVTSMADLIESADIVLPNLTEACYLAETEHKADKTVEFAKEVVRRLAERTNATIVLTGVEQSGKIGELIYSCEKFTEIWAEKLPYHFHGTGDIFASIFTAVYLQSGDMRAACEIAGDFIATSIRVTDASHTYGVNFEYALKNRKL